MSQKPFKHWTYQELVDHCAGEILKGLLIGSFRTSVYCSLDLALRWKEEYKEPKKKKRK